MFDMEFKEIIATSIKAYGKEINGCIFNKKDVMIIVNSEKESHDIFLTNEQAIELINNLTQVVNRNQNEQ